MIRTRFFDAGSWTLIDDVQMPNPVRVGEKVEFGDGFSWEVTEVTWFVDPEGLVDEHGARPCALKVKLS